PPKLPTITGPSPNLPIPTNPVCYSITRLHPQDHPQPPSGNSGTSFKRPDMLQQILETCNKAKDWGFVASDPVANDKRLFLRSVAAAETIFKDEKSESFSPQRCVDGMVVAMDGCDRDKEEKWGGEVDVEGNFFYVYAGSV
ncbi:MAG: hypothetical protein Q9224_007589, partial [Gallowayella concinna]